MSSSKFKVNGAEVAHGAARLDGIGKRAHDRTSTALGRAARLGATAGHPVFGALVDGVVQKLRSNLPHDIELLIASYAEGLLEIDAAAGDTDSSLAHAARQSAASGVNGAMAHGGGVTIANLAEAANISYGRSGSVPGYKPATAAQLKKLGITAAMLRDTASGFQATVLFNSKDGKYILSFAGTDPRDGADIVNDVQGGVYLSRQTEEALQLAALLTLGVGKARVTFTGHSLGGRLAALSSVATGAPAVTFNAAGVSDPELLYARTLEGKPQSLANFAFNWPASILGMGGFVSGNPVGRGIDKIVAASQNIQDQVGVRHEYASQITNYATTNDPLTHEQTETAAPNALGKHVAVRSSANILVAHDMAAMQDALKD